MNLSPTSSMLILNRLMEILAVNYEAPTDADDSIDVLRRLLSERLSLKIELEWWRERAVLFEAYARHSSADCRKALGDGAVCDCNLDTLKAETKAALERAPAQ